MANSVIAAVRHVSRMNERISKLPVLCSSIQLVIYLVKASPKKPQLSLQWQGPALTA